MTFRELGRQSLKNIAKPVEVYAIQLDGGGSPGSRFLAAANLKQEIRYCRQRTGVGSLTPPSATTAEPRSAHWWHRHYDLLFRSLSFSCWTCPKSHLGPMTRAATAVVLDVDQLSLGIRVSDMETVADAAGLGRFPLVVFSQGCAVSIAYAVRHPERVSHFRSSMAASPRGQPAAERDGGKPRALCGAQNARQA